MRVATSDAVSSPPRVRFATVGPPVEPWRSELIRFVRSIRMCAGVLANSEVVCYLDREIDRSLATELRELGARVVLVGPVDRRCAMGNNLLMLEEGAYDWLVACDCDVVVARSFQDELVGDAIGLCPVVDGLCDLGTWRAFYEAFGLSMPPLRVRTVRDAEPCPPYFNAGVLLVPGSLVSPLARAWRKWLGPVVDAFETNRIPSGLRQRRAFVDQLAFALALAEGELFYRPMSVAMNFSTTDQIHAGLHPDMVDPAFLHYHHRIDDQGRIVKTGYWLPDRRIAKVNQLLSNTSSEATPHEGGKVCEASTG